MAKFGSITGLRSGDGVDDIRADDMRAIANSAEAFDTMTVQSPLQLSRSNGRASLSLEDEFLRRTPTERQVVVVAVTPPILRVRQVGYADRPPRPESDQSLEFVGPAFDAYPWYSESLEGYEAAIHGEPTVDRHTPMFRAIKRDVWLVEPQGEVPPSANIIECIIGESPSFSDRFLTIREVERDPLGLGTLKFVGDPIPRVSVPYPYRPHDYVYQVPYAGLTASGGGPWFHAYSFGEEGEEEWHLLDPPAGIGQHLVVRIHRDETTPPESRLVPCQFLIFNPTDGNRAILSTPLHLTAHPGYTFGSYATSGDARPAGSTVLLDSASSRNFRMLINVVSGSLGADTPPRPYDWQFRPIVYLERP